MTQQINLFDARFAPQRLRFSALHGGLACAGVLVLSLLAAQGLRLAAGSARADAQAAQAGLAPLRAEVDALNARRPGGEDAELARLRAVEAGQRQVRAALEAGAAGVRDGHAGLLMALARQASGRLWITGIAVSDDGAAIDLEGRMTDSSVLADYLRRLNDEPRFRGRPFAQLTLKSAGNGGERLPWTEFVLRSTPAGSAGTATTVALQRP
ncbi:MAG TPA: PilN domain-containing protein [Aquabacterium sp.]|nr:PilN domain-containing protein [Aquabacterium sp.]